MSVTIMVVVGAFVGKAYNNWVARRPNADVAQRLGVLLASGLIVGESLFGVLLSGIIVASKKDAPLALVGDSFQTPATWIGSLAFIAVLVVLYRWIGNVAQRIRA